MIEGKDARGQCPYGSPSIPYQSPDKSFACRAMRGITPEVESVLDSQIM